MVAVVALHPVMASCFTIFLRGVLLVVFVRVLVVANAVVVAVAFVVVFHPHVASCFTIVL